MAKIIKESDFIDPSALEAVWNDLSKIADEGMKADQAISKLAKDMKQLKVPALNVKELTDAEKKIRDVNKLYEDKAKIDLQNLKIQQEQERLAGIRDRNERARAKEQERIAKQQEVANAKKLKAEKEMNSAYQQTQKRASALYQQLRDLAIVGDTNSKTYRKLKSEYDQLDKSLKEVDATFGKHQRNVGNYPTAINGITSALGKLGIAFSGIALARNAFGIIEEFDEKVADVQKTTGFAKDEVEALSMELGKLDTRTSVTALQELASAGGRLGLKTKKEILDFAESADKAFVALGDDLGGTAEEIATNLGKIASTFGDEGRYGIGEAITRTGSALNELSANSKASAGAILDFTNRMAGVASLSGIAQTDIQALGALFDSTGQSIEVASTTLNTLLPKLSTDYERFAKIAGMSAEEFKKLAGKDAIEALKRVAIGAKSSQAGLNGLNETLEAFGIESARGAAIVGTLAGNVDELTKLQKISNEAFSENVSLQNEFNTKNSTLAGGVEKLKKEWDLWVLSLTQSTGATNRLVWLFNTLAKNLPTILSLLGKLITLWITWKTVMKAQEIANYVKGIGGLSGAFNQLKGSVEGATTSTKAFNTALKSIGWTAVIAVGMEVAKMFYDVASGALEARIRVEEYNKAINFGSEWGQGGLNQLKNQVEYARKQASEEIKDSQKLEAELKKIDANYIQRIKDRIKVLNDQKEAIKENYKLDDNDRLRLESAKTKNLALRSPYEKELVINERNYNNALNRTNAELKVYIAELNDLTKAKVDDTIQTTLNTKAEEKHGKAVKDKINDWTKAIRDLKTSELTELKKALAELENAYSDNVDKIQSNDIKAKEYRLELERKFNKDRIKLIEDYEAEQDRKRKEMREASRDDKYDFEGIAIDASAQNAQLDRLQAYFNRRAQIIATYENDREKMMEELAKAEEEMNIQSLESTITYSQKKIEAIRSVYEELLSTSDELLSESDLKRKKQFEKEINDYQVQVLEADIELQNQRNKANEKTLNSLKDFWAQTSKFITDIIQRIQEQINKMYDRQINAQNRIISKSQEMAQRLNDAYAVGNQKATESVLAEEKRQEQALKRIEQIERRRQRMQLLTSFLSAGANALGGFGSGADAKAQVNSFLNALPKFEKGTEFFSTQGGGLDGRGGAPAILHDKERVLTAQQNAMIGYTTPNVEVAETMYKKRTGQLTEGSSFDALEVIKPLAQEIKEGFKNITSVNTNVDSIIDGVLKVTTTKQQGRVRIIDTKRYKA